MPQNKTPSYRLAACAEMMFLDLPIIDRVREIARRGFEVEIWSWQSKDLDQLAATGATFSSMTGYLRGDLTTDAGVAELLSTAEESAQKAEIIGVPRLNLHGTGLNAEGLPVIPHESVSAGDYLIAADTLRRIGDIGRRYDIQFTLENLNTRVDHPGVPFAKASETLSLIKAVDDPHIRMNLDLYHAQIGEGNLIELIDESFDYVGEIQIADVPGRCEPETGEIRYSAIAEHLIGLNYNGVVSLEGWSRRPSEEALEVFAETFRIRNRQDATH